jgi:hypothetical protein
MMQNALPALVWRFFALDPLLLEHRSRIFHTHFRDPMEL